MVILNLIKNNLENVEKRRLPRFPFSSLVFKSQKKQLAYEVKDISNTGMQVAVKDGIIPFQTGDELQGELHWKTAITEVKGIVQWVKDSRMGVAFQSGDLSSFLSIENILPNLKPIHDDHFDVELPEDLKYWVMAEGPVEVFVWKQRDGDIGRFQIILFDRYLEWQAHKDLLTGRVLTKRSLDTPLLTEDEMVFGEDIERNEEVLSFARDLISQIPSQILSEGVQKFILKSISEE